MAIAGAAVDGKSGSAIAVFCARRPRRGVRRFSGHSTRILVILKPARAGDSSELGPKSPAILQLTLLKYCRVDHTCTKWRNTPCFPGFFSLI
jgi:hypothetical protein